MSYQFQFRPYQHPFKQPLKTHHGVWSVRAGILLQLTDAIGRVAWGEIAPLSGFGSETLEQALCFCQQLPPQINQEIITTIPNTLPACQFGFESAWEALNPSQPETVSAVPLSYSGLLSAGELALNQWPDLFRQGYRTFKWKIAVAPIAEELEILDRLIQGMKSPGLDLKLRLDANGGLTFSQAQEWLRVGDGCNRGASVQLEFLEQPLPPREFEELLALGSSYRTPIALDESVATLSQLQACYARGWRGIFVIKPAIAGSPSQLRQFCKTHRIDGVFSSVFETSIGRNAILKLAQELSNPQRAIGFGVSHWLEVDP
ncbi:MAG: o-succinylbenzoate synthase [Oscillatoriales cyanobacterium RM2_1_1]|nr:o-succinylbenzoate synthase [Oscillatoriales cyanobacterium SM2_3_0]NJO45504.1 o-succinylbenzoate synthase [Oscillatoriales cyanobacterium RM2_1_1]